MREIKVKVKQVYGVDRIYPMSYVKELEALTGTKTLSEDHIKALKALGFTLEVVSDTVTL